MTPRNVFPPSRGHKPWSRLQAHIGVAMKQTSEVTSSSVTLNKRILKKNRTTGRSHEKEEESRLIEKETTKPKKNSNETKQHNEMRNKNFLKPSNLHSTQISNSATSSVFKIHLVFFLETLSRMHRMQVLGSIHKKEKNNNHLRFVFLLKGLRSKHV